MHKEKLEECESSGEESSRNKIFIYFFKDNILPLSNQLISFFFVSEMIKSGSQLAGLTHMLVKQAIFTRWWAARVFCGREMESEKKETGVVTRVSGMCSCVGMDLHSLRTSGAQSVRTHTLSPSHTQLPRSVSWSTRTHWGCSQWDGAVAAK